MLRDKRGRAGRTSVIAAKLIQSPLMRALRVAIAIHLVLTATLHAAAAADDHLPDRAWTLISQRCLACHGDGKKIRSGLDLRSHASALKGGERGPAIVS